MDASSSGPEPRETPPSSAAPSRWWSERFGAAARAPFGSLRVPNDRSRFGWHLAGLALLCLLVQAVTGLLLLVHFRPGEHAWESVAHLSSQVPFGWLVRGLHALCSHLLVALALLHLGITFASRAFRRPRELTWIAGSFVLALVLALAATGAALPGDQASVLAARVDARLLASVPMIGPTLASIAAGGGSDLEIAHRFFAFHVGMLPAALLLAATAHLALVRAHGSSCSASTPTVPWFPDFLRRELVVWIVALGLLSAVVALWPPPMLPRHDALQPAPEGLRPAWYFMPAYQAIRLLPARLGPLRGEQVAVVAALLSFGALCLAPFWASSRRQTARRATTVIVAALAVITIVFAACGYSNG